MSVSKGNCYLCGKEIGKTALKNHIIKNHAVPEGQECYLLKIEGAYEKDYWLYVDIPVESTLKTLDGFLRKIWLECCGHMSAFRSGSGNAGMGRKLKDFETGEQLLHEYDFGSTTETLVTFMGTVYREQQRGVRLLGLFTKSELRERRRNFAKFKAISRRNTVCISREINEKIHKIYRRSPMSDFVNMPTFSAERSARVQLLQMREEG